MTNKKNKNPAVKFCIVCGKQITGKGNRKKVKFCGHVCREQFRDNQYETEDHIIGVRMH